MTKIKDLKIKLRDYLFGTEYKLFLFEKKQFEDRYKKLTITDLVREKMKGFNPHLLDTSLYSGDVDGTPSIMDDLPEEGEDIFLKKVKDLAENTALGHIIDYVCRNQILYSARYAIGIDEINFGRASVNGATLIKEEVARLFLIYQERHPPDEEKFDKHAILSE